MSISQITHMYQHYIATRKCRVTYTRLQKMQKMFQSKQETSKQQK